MGTQTTQTNAPQSPAERAGTVGHEAKQATKDVAATAGQEAQRVSREAKDQARRLWSQTRSELTDQAATQQGRAAGGLRELAGQLDQMANSADQDGMARGLVEDVARRASDAATWLDRRDPGSLLDEVRTYARRRPGAFLAIAAGVGLLAGRMSRSLVEEARESDESSTGAAATGTSSTGTPSTGKPSTGAPPVGTYSTGTYSTGAAATGNEPVGSERTATTPSADLPGPHRTTQPIDPDGTPAPIGSDGHLTAAGDDPLRGER